MGKIFDFHFHLLFKHYIARKTEDGKKYELNENIKTFGIADKINDLMGGAFDSQSSPIQINNSELFLGVSALLSVEHAFANRILQILGIDASRVLPLDWDIFEKTRNGETTYWNEFTNQIDFYLKSSKALEAKPYNIIFLNRNNFFEQNLEDIKSKILTSDKRCLALSIEGGHNFSNVPIHNQSNIKSKDPDTRLKEIQDRADIDFISINLCHLSEIPEQPLAGFAQGLNWVAQIAFHSDDFKPKTGKGISEIGRRFIEQALSHKTKPILIDVKHMSLYSRLDYYKLKEKLSVNNIQIDKLPIISSHTGFTFTPLEDFIGNKKYVAEKNTINGVITETTIQSKNRKIGRTNDIVNKGLYCNPWTINLFDEEIIEIMKSNGMIGLSIDQRVLGSSNLIVDSARLTPFNKEYVPIEEWDKLFINGQLPNEESFETLERIWPKSSERHIMLLCLHIVHAVRVGYNGLSWVEGNSPWKCICLGTDFDGLINPINGLDNISNLSTLKEQLLKYIPIAEKYLLPYEDIKALNYDKNGKIDLNALNENIEDFLFNNGVNFIARYLNNWGIKY